MRGSLPIHAWTLLLLCGWTAWSAVQERAAIRRGVARDALTPPVPDPAAPETRLFFALPSRPPTRSLPN